MPLTIGTKAQNWRPEENAYQAAWNDHHTPLPSGAPSPLTLGRKWQ
jgi:hypothetical protein